MLELFINTLRSKKFYSTGYKKVSKVTVMYYLVVLGLLYSLVLTPINTYSGFKEFSSFKSEVNTIPPALEASLKNGSLTSNFSKPLEINLSKNTVIIIDPKNTFTTYDTLISYIVFKERGLVFVANSEMSNQEYPKDLNLKISATAFIKSINSVQPLNLAFFLGLVYLLSNFFNILIAVIFISCFFGFFYHVMSGIFIKQSNTLMQNIKRILFICVYFVIGSLVSSFTNNSFVVNYLPFFVFGLSYLILIGRVKQ